MPLTAGIVGLPNVGKDVYKRQPLLQTRKPIMVITTIQNRFCAGLASKMCIRDRSTSGCDFASMLFDATTSVLPLVSFLSLSALLLEHPVAVANKVMAHKAHNNFFIVSSCFTNINM